MLFRSVSFMFKGVSVEVKLARYYPYGELFAHALGYVGRISDKEAAKLDPERYAGTDLIGKTGLEKFYENLLQGKAGYQQVEANAHGQALRLLERIEPTRGNDLILHLDYGLQKMISEQLAGKRGAVVAIDPKTGGVLAFVSTPSFDPNPFVALFWPREKTKQRSSADVEVESRRDLRKGAHVIKEAQISQTPTTNATDSVRCTSVVRPLFRRTSERQ